MNSSFKSVGLISLTVVISCALLIGAAYGYVLASFGDETPGLALKKPIAGEPYTILLVGLDKRPEISTYRPDALVLAKIHPKNKTIHLVSIPRDYHVEMARTGEGRISEAYIAGGAPLLVQTIEEIVGIPVNHIVTLDVNGFAKAIDSMGGITLNIPADLIAELRSNGPTDEPSKITAGKQVLDGIHALWFVRRRGYADGDMTRMRAQRVFLGQFFEQVRRMNTLRQARLAWAFAPYVSTDLTLGQAREVLEDLRIISPSNIASATLPGTWQSPFVKPDFAQLFKLRNELQTGYASP